MSYQPQSQFGGGFPQQQQQQKGCWGRNWKWIVPSGCLVLILAVVGAGFAIFYFAMSTLKSTEVYQESLRRARANTEVVEQLGEPIKDGWWVKGNVSVGVAGGYAAFEIPISGPKKKATIWVVATKDSGTWMYDTLDVAVEGGQRFSILEPGEGEPPPPPEPLSEEDENSNIEGVEGGVGVGGGDAAPPSTKSLTVSGGVLNGKAISKPDPVYPPVAKAARASGAVTVQVTVDEAGKVISAKAVSGHPLLRAAAEAAARQARFSPTLLSGKPVKVTGVLIYNFTLE
jgi:TonB family protein